MDPISHVVFGYAVVRATRPPVWRLAVAAGIAALAPDVDAVFMLCGWDIYLRIHEIGTHALVGTAPVALAVAVAVRGRSRAPIGSLFLAAWLATLSHLALDTLSGARIRLAWPFIEGRSVVPLASMAEPWLIAIFAVSVLALAVSRLRRRTTARCVLAVLTLFFGLKMVWLVQSMRTLGPAAPAAVEARIIEARWFTLREWHVFERSPTRLSHVIVTPGRPPILVESWPRTADTLLIARSRRLDTVRNLLAVHELTFAREQPGARGQTDVLWSDIRFCWSPSGASANDAADGPLVLGPAPTRIACGLWFGGTYDQAGRALIQRVQVLGRWQTRPTRP